MATNLEGELEVLDAAGNDAPVNRLEQIVHTLDRPYSHAQPQRLDTMATHLSMLTGRCAQLLADAEPPRRARASGRTGGCWGGCLAGNLDDCHAVDATAAPTAHFKYKLCSACQTAGILVPAERVRMIQPAQHELFTNCATANVWTERQGDDGRTFLFRTVNQTAKCAAPRHRCVTSESEHTSPRRALANNRPKLHPALESR